MCCRLEADHDFQLWNCVCILITVSRVCILIATSVRIWVASCVCFSTIFRVLLLSCAPLLTPLKEDHCGVGLCDWAGWATGCVRVHQCVLQAVFPSLICLHWHQALHQLSNDPRAGLSPSSIWSTWQIDPVINCISWKSRHNLSVNILDYSSNSGWNNCALIDFSQLLWTKLPWQVDWQCNSVQSLNMMEAAVLAWQNTMMGMREIQKVIWAKLSPVHSSSSIHPYLHTKPPGYNLWNKCFAHKFAERSASLPLFK